MESQATTELKARIVTAALDHVPFDGWSDAALCAALSDCDVDTETGRALFPRGAVDLALAFQNLKRSIKFIGKIFEHGLFYFFSGLQR